MTACGRRTPDVGHMYDALLGGKHNFAEDRQAARRLIAAIPDIATGARANRAWFGSRRPRSAPGTAIARFFDGQEMAPRGLRDVASWRAGPGPAGRVRFPGGVGRKQ